MHAPHAAPPARHRVELPEDATEVVGVFVDGVELPREGYELRDGHLWLHRPVRPARPLSRRQLLRIALCVETEPEGQQVDVLVRRRGRVESVPVGP